MNEGNQRGCIPGRNPPIFQIMIEDNHFTSVYRRTLLGPLQIMNEDNCHTFPPRHRKSVILAAVRSAKLHIKKPTRLLSLIYDSNPVGFAISYSVFILQLFYHFTIKYDFVSFITFTPYWMQY